MKCGSIVGYRLRSACRLSLPGAYVVVGPFRVRVQGSGLVEALYLSRR